MLVFRSRYCGKTHSCLWPSFYCLASTIIMWRLYITLLTPRSCYHGFQSTRTPNWVWFRCTIYSRKYGNALTLEYYNTVQHFVTKHVIQILQHLPHPWSVPGIAWTLCNVVYIFSVIRWRYKYFCAMSHIFSNCDCQARTGYCEKWNIFDN